MLVKKLDKEYKDSKGYKISTLGTGIYWYKKTYSQLVNLFGKETTRIKDHPNSSLKSPDEVFWYLELFDGRVGVIHNQALRDDPPPERCKNWRFAPSYDFVGYKMLEYIMDHKNYDLIEFIFTQGKND